MPNELPNQHEFLTRIAKIIGEHLSDEQFGVSELAHEIGMSRSNLLRKVKALTKLSVSQLIRQTRLEHARKMLSQSSLTISEISFKVGFSSTSYFIKCFREYYGYPPGEVSKRNLAENEPIQTTGPSQSHQLVAIMFTDIQGYTALMQQDEQQALEFRRRHRKVFNEVTKKYQGKILQYYGDGTLSTFASVIDAVWCGIEMQLKFSEAPRIPLRIGIHSGDIIVSENDIVGDSVNVASRIESLATVQSVFISEKVYDEVKNQSGIQTVSLGVFELKNVTKPMEVFAISNPGLIVPKREQLTGNLKHQSLADGKKPTKSNRFMAIKWVVVALAIMLAGYLLYTRYLADNTTQPNPISTEATAKKSIAVLPFINDSNDSTNVYIINGLMESILNNLQKIEDLRVISRTSVEKYRNASKTISEISEELNVKYFVEGSGQKIGDQILLNVQLIDAHSDKHLWSKQYTRETKDIFQLQLEVAKIIAAGIEVVITPEEEKRIEKLPTENLVAYDFFLKGLDFFYKGTREGLIEAIPLFKKAVEHDNEFARAYADIAICYYYLDIYQAEKKYTEDINSYADKALLYDSQLPQSLVAKALFYITNEEYQLAIPHLEKALEYNPNSAMVIGILSDFYSIYSPNSGKYLEYALKGIQLDIASHDSATASIVYLHLSNAFIQSGFIDEAENYANQSLAYNPDNLFSEQVKAYILYARNKDLEQTKQLLLKAFSKDTTRLDVMQEVAKIHYFMRDYRNAFTYYQLFSETKEALNLDIYGGEDAKIAVVLSKLGKEAESERYIEKFKEFAENDESIYHHISLAVYYSYQGDTKKAIQHLRVFSQEDNYPYWIPLFLGIDPLVDNIKQLPEFQKIVTDLETKFWNNHETIKASLKEKGLL